MNGNWSGILLGILLIVSGTWKIVTGQDGQYWGFPVPAWTGWVFLFVGIAAIVLSISGLRRAARKEPLYSDQEVEHAKAALTRMYLHDHGALPKEETPEENAPPYKEIPMSWYWLGIAFGVSLSAWGMWIIHTRDRGNYLRPPLLERISLPFLCIGIFLTAASIRALWLGRKEAKRATASLTHMPMREHDTPLKEKTPEEAPKDEAPRREDSSR